VRAFRLEYLTDIPYDPQLEETIFRGEPLKKMDGSPIMKSIATIIDAVGG
jgi:CO dehydrogenase nickel-insertion accessory protein CooC1